RRDMVANMGESESVVADRWTRPSEALLQRIAVHEASHAIARLVFDLDTITEISIDAPCGGYVLAETEVYEENTRPYFEAHLCMKLAGRAGEKEFHRRVCAYSG